MAALNVPSLADVKAGSSAEGQPLALPQASHSSEPVSAAFASLLEALHFARDLHKDPWEFAVEIVTLHRLGVSNSGLRWLVARGLVNHGVEVTGENDAERAFHRPVQLVTGRTTCFVLTPEGEAVARELFSRSAVARTSPSSFADGIAQSEPAQPAAANLVSDDKENSTSPSKPAWDRNRLQLRVDQLVVLQFKLPDADQEQILATFAEQNWPARIENPLGHAEERAPADRLARAVAALNRRTKPRLIEFAVDDQEGGVCWRRCENRPAGATG